MLYPGPGQAILLYKNRIGYLFQNEQFGAGLASVAFQLARIDANKTGPFGVSFQVAFSASPGTWQVDIQDSDIDTDGAYVTIASISGGLTAGFNGRIELPNIWAKFVRGKIVGLTNAVNTTLSCSH